MNFRACAWRFPSTACRSITTSAASRQLTKSILQNIDGREMNIHWVITRPMLARAGYLEEYVAFWSGRAEVDRIWVSVYTPQIGEQSAEMLTAR